MQAEIFYSHYPIILTLSHYTHSIPLYSHYPIILALIPLYSQYPIILTVSHYTISACLFFELRICVLIQRVSENLENGIYIGTSQTLLYFTKLLFHKLWLHWKLRCIHWLKSTCITTAYSLLQFRKLSHQEIEPAVVENHAETASGKA